MPITVFAAASLAKPLEILADSFTQREGVQVHRELGGSLEHARKITDLHRVPDVLLLVDDNVLASLVPDHLDWYVRFATNKLGVVYAARSQFAGEINTANWWKILIRKGVAVGRADPDIAPAGRLALGLMKRAESYYKQPHLTDSLLSRALLRFVRPNAAELAALLETGEVDYILDYESVARQYGFKFVALPEDLMPPVLYGVSAPRRAAHVPDAERFVAFMLSKPGRQILANANIDLLRVPVPVGSKLPQELSELVRSLDASPTAR